MKVPNHRALSPWAQDQRRIRRLRAKVRAERQRADRWRENSDTGWAAARLLHTHITKAGIASAAQQAQFDSLFENEPF